MFNPVQVPTTDPILAMLRDDVDYKIALYREWSGIINPYTLYNNQDRFLNVSVRNRQLVDWTENAANAEAAKFVYELRTSRLNLYLGAITAYASIGYAFIGSPSTIR